MEYFVYANSFAAPFCSDDSTRYVTAESASEALELFAAMYSHPCGLYSAQVWQSADDYHKGKPALAKWQSNRLTAELDAKAGKSCYSFLGISPEEFQVDGELYLVEDPKAGRVVESKR